MKIIVYGVGEYLRNHEIMLPEGMEIIAYGDGATEKATSRTGEKFRGLEVLLPTEIKDVEYDYLYISTGRGPAMAIYEDLKRMGFPTEKIRFLYQADSWTNWDLQTDGGGVMVSDIGGVKIREKDSTDHGMLGEVFSVRCYNIDIIRPDTVVVDFGMNIGAATLFFASNPNVEKVYGFEPFPDTYNAALENISLNEETVRNKIRTFNCAVADFDGDREIAVLTEFLGGRTTEINVVEGVSDKRRVTVRYRDAGRILRGIIAENGRKHIVIKIDTEGSEFPIFRSMKSLLGRFDAVVMEYHRDPQDMLAALRENGYRCVTVGVKTIGMIYAVNMDEKV